MGSNKKYLTINNLASSLVNVADAIGKKCLKVPLQDRSLALEKSNGTNQKIKILPDHAFSDLSFMDFDKRHPSPEWSFEFKCL